MVFPLPVFRVQVNKLLPLQLLQLHKIRRLCRSLLSPRLKASWNNQILPPRLPQQLIPRELLVPLFSLDKQALVQREALLEANPCQLQMVESRLQLKDRPRHHPLRLLKRVLQRRLSLFNLGRLYKLRESKYRHLLLKTQPQ